MSSRPKAASSLFVVTLLLEKRTKIQTSAKKDDPLATKLSKTDDSVKKKPNTGNHDHENSLFGRGYSLLVVVTRAF